MRTLLTVVGLVGSACLSVVAGSSYGHSTDSAEPFRSFHALDGKLSILQSRLAALQNAVSSKDASFGGSKDHAWQGDAKQLTETGQQIEQIAAQLERRYMGNRFGVKVFGVLRQRATDLIQQSKAASSAADRSTAKSTSKELEPRVLALVLQYDAVSAGYTALNCSSNEWSCCEPKSAVQTSKEETNACRWMCVKAAGRCSGLLGSRAAKAR
jgi:hypothetical protein